MKKLLLKLQLFWIILSVAAFAQNIEVYTTDNADGKITPQTIEAAFVKTGFYTSENRDMNLPFTKQFKESSFDVYNLFTFYSKPQTLELAKKYPQVGLFAPLSMSIYTKKGQKSISVSRLSKAALATILEIPQDEPALVKIDAMLSEAIKLALPNAKLEKLPYTIKPLKDAKLVTRYESEMDAEEWEDAKDEFQMQFEGELSQHGFVMAGFNDLNYDFKEQKYEGYTFYDVYSICKLPVIYTVAKVRPEAGAFAPCSLYLYMKKGEDKMHIAYPSVYNWISSLSVEDNASLGVLKDAQTRMEKILSGLTE